MTITQPLAPPHWADNPPVAPPTTITEPTEPEKDVGFQPVSLAQTVEVVIATVTNSTLYRFTVDGNNIDYTSDASATMLEIQNGLIAAFVASPSNAKAIASIGIGSVVVTARAAGQAFVLIEGDSKLTLNVLQGNRTSGITRQYINWILNLLSQWVAFLWAIAFNSNDFALNFPVPGSGSNPTTGPGLSGSIGGAVAYVLGRRLVGPTGTPTYSANSDTYIDLSPAGDWVYLPVSNGATPPAIGSNHQRLYKIVTNGSDRTAFVDLRVDSIPFTRHPMSFANVLPVSDAGASLGSTVLRWLGVHAKRMSIYGAAGVSALDLNTDAAADADKSLLYATDGGGGVTVQAGIGASAGAGPIWLRGRNVKSARDCVSHQGFDVGTFAFTIASGAILAGDFIDVEIVLSGLARAVGAADFAIGHIFKVGATYGLTDDDLSIAYPPIINAAGKLEIHLHNRNTIAAPAAPINVTGSVLILRRS